MQYIDGIDDFSYTDGIVRGNLVVLQKKSDDQDNESAESTTADAPSSKFKTVPVGTVVMPLRAALQIHAALDELIKKLIENQVIQPPKQVSNVLNPE